MSERENNATEWNQSSKYKTFHKYFNAWIDGTTKTKTFISTGTLRLLFVFLIYFDRTMERNGRTSAYIYFRYWAYSIFMNPSHTDTFNVSKCIHFFGLWFFSSFYFGEFHIEDGVFLASLFEMSENARN